MEYMLKQHTVTCKSLIKKLEEEQILSKEEYLYLIQHKEEGKDILFERARRICDEIYGKAIYIRGLIEFTNICKNNCYYCGIRKDNNNCERYRLSKEEILNCADNGYSLGFRTFVLQGGEDGFFTDRILCDIVRAIKQKHPDCAIALSVGERSYESFKNLKKAGADRYLLRHETANPLHYEKLHPTEMRFSNRIQCLKNLKELGYQIGAGFMVGSPYQTEEDLAGELLFLKELNPKQRYEIPDQELYIKTNNREVTFIITIYSKNLQEPKVIRTKVNLK